MVESILLRVCCTVDSLLSGAVTSNGGRAVHTVIGMGSISPRRSSTQIERRS